jgi:hypothetical protein
VERFFKLQELNQCSRVCCLQGPTSAEGKRQSKCSTWNTPAILASRSSQSRLSQPTFVSRVGQRKLKVFHVEHPDSLRRERLLLWGRAFTSRRGKVFHVEHVSTWQRSSFRSPSPKQGAAERIIGATELSATGGLAHPEHVPRGTYLQISSARGFYLLK